MRSAISFANRGRIVAGLCFFTVGAGCALSSCGGKNAGFGPDAGDAGRKPALDGGVESAMEGGSACQPPSDMAEPEVPALVTFDGGVPLGQVPFALAVARCNYWNRCSPFAPYVLKECIEALSQTGAWTHPGGAFIYSFPSAGLFQAVDAGVIRYDPEQESACLQALQAQQCHGVDLWEDIPACASAFTCAPDVGGGDAGGSDGGAAADGGTPCSELPKSWWPMPAKTRKPCVADSDCASPALSGTPYCADGYCASEPCGDIFNGCSFVGVGEPCDSDPPLFGQSMRATPWGTWPTSICSPGLTCAGLASNGSLGVCETAQDIGGPCVQDAVITGCSIGLTCQCGTCQVPPSRGPCASGLCQVGVAYCDRKSNLCLPVKQLGYDCADGVEQCAANLVCDGDTNTCQSKSL